MIRKYLRGAVKEDKDRINWRSHEPKRIEAFSDAVFAFAVSLLAFSLEVPKSSKELLDSFVSFFPFVFCFASLFSIWLLQYKFFRRYGLSDQLTIVLNGVLILVVLCYVYPLKFLFGIMFISYEVRPEDCLPLTIIYNAGICIIYLLFALMYFNAYGRREELKLSAIEAFETKTQIYIFSYTVCVGLVVILFAILLGRQSLGANSGWALMAFLRVVDGRRNKKFKKLFGDAKMVEPELGDE